MLLRHLTTWGATISNRLITADVFAFKNVSGDTVGGPKAIAIFHVILIDVAAISDFSKKCKECFAGHKNAKPGTDDLQPKNHKVSQVGFSFSKAFAVLVQWSCWGIWQTGCEVITQLLPIFGQWT